MPLQPKHDSHHHSHLFHREQDQKLVRIFPKRVEVVRAPTISATFVRPEEVERRISACIGGRRIGFTAGKAELTPAGMAIIDEVSAAISMYPHVDICIEGHTACQPRHDFGTVCNLRPLSRDRAEGVKELMRVNGVASNITVTGWGCLHPEIRVIFHTLCCCLFCCAKYD